ncbi:MAG: HDOD domain-containing protein [Desulfovibrionaceae bacterium]|jgi:putative nucleotidyltransferase with HDIG domain|nr:HDOD domain-containing protein [Desulfovibrionaceae bacterium]
MTPLKVLFVDDEQQILDGLRRMLRHKARDWDMDFAISGARALEVLAEHPVDVLVTDMRMPEMDGGRLLEEVVRRHPRVARVVLSGHSGQDMAAQAARSAHLFLSKPCPPETLIEALDRFIWMREIAADGPLLEVITGLERLPVLPDAYRTVAAELTKEDPSLDVVAAAVSRDVGMSAKVLQLVNSSFFGFYRTIDSVRQAVTLLGVNTVRHLVLALHLFDAYDPAALRNYSLAKLWQHSLRTAGIARAIAEAETGGKPPTPQHLADVFFAGLLHDVGKLVLASNLGPQYQEIIDALAAKDAASAHCGGVAAEELRRFGASHAEVGAYLMGLWGMDREVVEAIARHHRPELPAEGYSMAAAVAVANHLDHDLTILTPGRAHPTLDAALVRRVGGEERLAAWRAAAEAQIGNKNAV